MALADASLAVVQRPCHIVALPYPGRGHINPMLSLCRLLAERSSSIVITVVLTEEWLGLLGSPAPPLPECIRLATIPNVIPSEHGRAADFSGFIEAVHTRMEAPVEQLLRGMAAAPAAVVADMFLPWAVPMALRMGVTACSFCPSAAAHFAAFYHLESLVAAHRTTGRDGDSFTVTACSICSVSLGSFLSVSPSQIAELAMGLAASDVKFLWALRGEQQSHVLQFLGDNNGILVPWCDQLKVLCHCSIGGFLTHCGMNSTLEGVFAGVPMLTLPIALDQPTDSRLIVDVWKLGFSIKEKMRSDGLIGRAEIALAVKNIMSVNVSGTNEVRRRANSLKEASK
ncbi:hypothetical protein HU200_025865 [Digitaria exilis]|uniref:UDP-glycosyltransferases domain-containing protein n=1 Tax=Digitaria exilis TaxID=1010633 RepID=A0A835BZ79_9POAL|nr:hypothetical protein HU200_025865 [Digitaria exilis]CAB3478615.1 unnamed protein product [Digitaria exilis]